MCIRDSANINNVTLSFNVIDSNTGVLVLNKIPTVHPQDKGKFDVKFNRDDVANLDTGLYEYSVVITTVEGDTRGFSLHMTLTEPGGKTSALKIPVTKVGYYETFIVVCCNNIGEYTVSASWKGHNIGTVTFDVVLKPKLQTTSTPAPTTTEDEQTEDQQQKQKSEQQKQKSKRGKSKNCATQTEESAVDQHETKKKDSDCKRKCR